ncbi:hypothetical protein D5086_001872 [Populus alba]|uniref:Uncharacterized protein n=1 Tax=Populus alba TaxID=43335 RepID=A0ACC4D046_POPAL
MQRHCSVSSSNQNAMENSNLVFEISFHLGTSLKSKRNVVPPDLLGSPANWRILRRNITKFIGQRKLKKFSLKQSEWSLLLIPITYVTFSTLAVPCKIPLVFHSLDTPNTIYMEDGDFDLAAEEEKGCGSYLKKERLLFNLTEHVKCNGLQLEDKFYLQVKDLSRRHSYQDASAIGSSSRDRVVSPPHYMLFRFIDDLLSILTSEK